MRRPSGWTLVELLVAMAVSLLALTVGLSLFLPAWKAWSQGQQRTEVDQMLAVALDGLGRDIARSAPGSVAWSTDGVLGMRCTEGHARDHQTLFDLQVAYWLDAGGLYRAAWRLSDPERETPPTRDEALQAPDRRNLARGVVAWQATTPSPWQVALHLELAWHGQLGERVTTFSSRYAPADLTIAQENQQP